MYQVGIDIGGTFTDAVLVTDADSEAKVPTTPQDLGASRRLIESRAEWRPALGALADQAPGGMR